MVHTKTQNLKQAIQIVRKCQSCLQKIGGCEGDIETLDLTVYDIEKRIQKEAGE